MARSGAAGFNHRAAKGSRWAKRAVGMGKIRRPLLRDFFQILQRLVYLAGGGGSFPAVRAFVAIFADKMGAFGLFALPHVLFFQNINLREQAIQLQRLPRIRIAAACGAAVVKRIGDFRALLDGGKLHFLPIKRHHVFQRAANGIERGIVMRVAGMAFGFLRGFLRFGGQMDERREKIKTRWHDCPLEQCFSGCLLWIQLMEQWAA